MKLLVALLVFFCATKADSFKVVCYYGSWAIYRPNPGTFNVSNIDPSLCTDLIYTFIGLDLNLRVTSLDPQADTVLGSLKDFVALKDQNPSLRTTLAIGGWNEGSEKYSVMVSSPETRANFVDSVLNFLAFYGFDGIDVDWEYPTQRGGLEEDKANFVLLLQELKQKLGKWNKTVTIAISIADLTDIAYDVAEINKVVDAVHLMAYDYVSSNSETTGLNAPMSSVEATAQKWLDKGLDPSKLVLGMPAYARYWYLEDENNHGVGAKVTGPGAPSAYTLEPGYLTYYELLYMLDSYDFQIEYIDGTAYAYYGDIWITYDDNNTYADKVKYAIDQKYGGVMLWSIDTDDFINNDFPILNKINEVINTK